MLSVPLFTVCQAPRIFVTDNLRLGTLIQIRNLNLSIFFFDFPQFGLPSDAPYNMPGWIQVCSTLVSMTSLRYLCIFILQEHFMRSFELQSHARNVELVSELLEPLKSIKMARGGRFDVITQGWRVPYELSDDLPFRVIQERPPSLTDLANRTLELGHVSQSSYLKLASMPWPGSYRPWTAPTICLPTPAPTRERSRVESGNPERETAEQEGVSEPRVRAHV